MLFPVIIVGLSNEASLSQFKIATSTLSPTSNSVFSQERENTGAVVVVVVAVVVVVVVEVVVVVVVVVPAADCDLLITTLEAKFP
jgi:hypothetical protein